MKYTASITVIDDEGNAVFERELEADEIIEELLKEKDRIYIQVGKAEIERMRSAPEPEEQPQRPPSKTTPPGGFKQSDYRGELTCAHGVGHGAHVHGCDGCCNDLTTVDGKLVDQRVPEVTPAPAQKGKPGQKACKKCGEPGHMQKTCKKEPKPEHAIKEAFNRPEVKLTEKLFDKVHDAMHDRNFTALYTAQKLDTKVVEVVRATKCATYPDYEKAYEEAKA